MALANNKELAKKIEYIKRKGTKEYIEKQLEQNPFANSACLSLEGKGDFFCTGSISFGVGFGMGDSLAKRDVEQIEEYIRNKKGISHAHFELTPFCDPLLTAMLQERHYTFERFLSVWVLELDSWEAEKIRQTTNAWTIQKAKDEECDEWAWTVALGISKDQTVSEETMEAARVFLEVPGNTGFLLKQDGKGVAGGTLAIDGQLAELFLASTVAEYRGKGYQNRLIEERLRHAKARGCTHATATTEPNTVSARNMENNGFQLIYNKAVMKSQALL